MGHKGEAMRATTAELLEHFKRGEMIILMDDEDRENEGDLLVPAEKITADAINFMATFGRGLICLTLTKERCQKLNIPLMVERNNARHGTNFTISIEASKGVSTGISAADRATTVKAAVAKSAKPDDIIQPGHIFPLMAQPGGVLTRAGHTEAGCDLARLAGFEPAAVIVEILNEDGTMARRDDLEKFAARHNLRWGTIEDLIRYRIENEKTIERIGERKLTNDDGIFRLTAYRDNISDDIHLALVKGTPKPDRPTFVRVHVEDVFRDILREKSDSISADAALSHIAENLSGVFLLLRKQSPRTILAGVSANQKGSDDIRTYGVGAQILADLGVRKMVVLGSPRKLHGLRGFGLTVEKYVNVENH